ncbi:MAG: hypothetical protein WD801_03580 [Gemmatimonadaceae bacterium]
MISPSPLRSSCVTSALFRSNAVFGAEDPALRPVVGAGYFVSPGFLAAVGARRRGRTRVARE